LSQAADAFAILPAPLDPAREAAFGRALRHSRRVRRLRLGLPIASLAVVALLIGGSMVTRHFLGVGLGELSLTSDGIAMDAPRLSGTDGAGRTYTVTADRAVQQISDPRIIRLYGIVARVEEADGTWAEMTSAIGTYDSRLETVVLEEDIRARSAEGYSAALTRAEIDLGTGAVTSDAPVAFSSALGAVEARRMTGGQEGGSMSFGDGVRVTLTPGGASGDAGGEAAAGGPDEGAGHGDGN
jgi:lipopolysaccharide export system protein LptC